MTDNLHYTVFRFIKHYISISSLTELVLIITELCD